ncbi:unnamed protein product, partial [Rotaria magnacalcarata]
NNDRGGRLNNNDNNGGGFRGRSGFHRGGRDDTGTGNSSGQTRFFSRGNNRGGNQDHSLPHQS